MTANCLIPKRQLWKLFLFDGGRLRKFVMTADCFFAVSNYATDTVRVVSFPQIC